MAFCHTLTAIPEQQSISDTQITIYNKIKPDTLKKFGQKPDFSIKINGKDLKIDNSMAMTVQDNTFTVCYQYSFLKGVYKNANQITFKLENPIKQEYELNFSWDKKHEPYRVIISGAVPIDKKRLE